MSKLYADRGFLNLSGQELQDLTRISLSRNDGTKAVATFSRNRRNTGFVKGNREIRISFDIAVQDTLATPKIEDLDFEGNDYYITFEHGGDRYTATGLAYSDDTQDSSGVGSEGKKAYNMLALDIVDKKGNSALFLLGS